MSMFNDTYALKSPDKSEIEIHFEDIAWDSDKNSKFKDLDEDWASKQWISHNDEHFIVWMRTAGLPNFRKLWGRIDQDLAPGTYSMEIVSNWPVTSFEGTKSWVISNTNEFGGKNTFLSICYMVSGSLCILIGVVFGTAFGKRRP
jgi:hypothetical protein